MSTTSDEDLERFTHVHRKWEQSRASWGRFSFERIHVSFELLLLLGFLFVLLITPVDTILWSVRESAFRIELPIRLTWPTVAIILAFNGVWNGRLLHRVYLQKNLQERQVYPGIKILRLLLGVIPVLGFLTFVLWRRILQSRPGWIFRQHQNQPALALATREPQTWIEQLSDSHISLSSRTFLSLAASNTLASGALNQWVSGFSSTNPPMRPLVAGTVVMHLAAFLCISAFLNGRISSGSRAKLKNLIASLFWLLPVPYLPLAGVFFLSWVTAETQRSKTLMNHAFSRQEGEERLALWRGRHKILRQNRPSVLPWKRQEIGDVSSQARSRVLALCDVKSLAVTIDIAAVSWYLEFSTRASPAEAFFARGFLGLVMLGAFMLAFAGLATSLLALVRQWQRKPPSLWRGKTLARSLGLVSVFLFLGIIEGMLWHRGTLPYSKHPLLWVVAFYLSVKVLTLIRFLLPHGEKPAEGLADHLLRLLCLIGVWLGQILLSISAQVGSARLTLTFWAAYFFLWELLPGLIRLPWLLRPYHTRDLVSPVLPFSRKAVIAFLILTGLVPFGGLAAPLWVLWRHRLEIEMSPPAP